MTIQEWQDKHNVSNSELAVLAEIHVSYITHIKKGRRQVSAAVAERIERATNGEVSRWTLLYPNEQQPGASKEQDGPSRP